MAKTVPGTAQGMAIIPSSTPRMRSLRREARRAAAKPIARARAVATIAIQSELTSGRRCSEAVTRDFQLPRSSTGGNGSGGPGEGGTTHTSRRRGGGGRQRHRREGGGGQRKEDGGQPAEEAGGGAGERAAQLTAGRGDPP